MFRIKQSFTLSALAVCVLFGCMNENSFSSRSEKAEGHLDKGRTIFETFPGKNQIKIATYNVLNLFDAEHDEGKDDYSFLPSNYPGKTEYCEKLSNPHYKKECLETDWSDAAVDLKIGQIKHVFSVQGALPDLLALQEIENERVTARLAQALGYERFLVTTSPDERGIDVALLYQERMLQYVSHEEIVLQGKGLPESFSTGPTRNILKVDFLVKNAEKNRLTVYVNHWPSQAAPAPKRFAVGELLQKEMQTHVKDAEHYAIVLGDFNTLPEESPNAFHNALQDPSWPGALLDAQELSNRSGNPARNQMPFNSYYYSVNNRWEKLDRILFTKNFYDEKGVELLPKTFRFVADPSLLQPLEINAPGSFNHGAKQPRVSKRYDNTIMEKSKQGFSDHLPVTVIAQF